ncbi:hypothetical protein [Actinomadura harenae]|uniref:hypothetical protein n=1 Tax=Actinomadura harenae TaxID=2483351 RepID=UPI000EFAF07D|nr:hypothetical protein [Actinomadura harenae]
MTTPEENAPQSGPQRLPEDDGPEYVYITADQFRLPAVIAHINAGRIVIVGPATAPADPNPPDIDPGPA